MRPRCLASALRNDPKVGLFKSAMMDLNNEENLLHAPFFAGVTSGERPAKSSVYAPWIAVYVMKFSTNCTKEDAWRASSDFKFPGFKALDVSMGWLCT